MKTSISCIACLIAVHAVKVATDVSRSTVLAADDRRIPERKETNRLRILKKAKGTKDEYNKEQEQWNQKTSGDDDENPYIYRDPIEFRPSGEQQTKPAREPTDIQIVIPTRKPTAVIPTRKPTSVISTRKPTNIQTVATDTVGTTKPNYYDGHATSGGLEYTKCPSAVVIIQPEADRLGNFCGRGAVCQTRFDPSRDISSTLIGSDIESVVGVQTAFLLENTVSRQSAALLDVSFGDSCDLPTGSECFMEICLDGGTDSINYLFSKVGFTAENNPFRQEFVDLCRCIASGGVDCDRSCSCRNGRAFPPIPGATAFCDCYCACC